MQVHTHTVRFQFVPHWQPLSPDVSQGSISPLVIVRIMSAHSGPSFRYTLILLICFLGFALSSEWIEYPASGFATMTHYTLPLDFIASCGCSATSTHYPTAALNQMAYGSSTAYGPSCGRCFNLTLLNTFLSDPPFFPNVTKSVVVKVTDLCPLGGQWCSATPNRANRCVLDRMEL